MRLRTLWTIAGAAWGAVLGYAAGSTAFIFGTFYLWSRRIEANSWFELATVAIAVGVGAIVFLACAALGYWIGLGLERGVPHGELRREPGRGWRHLAAYAVIAAAILTPTIGAIQSYNAGKAHMRRQAEAGEQRRATRDAQTTNLDNIMATRHRVTGVAIDWPGDGGDFAATIDMEGTRAGAYRMTWRVRDGMANRALIEETQTLMLDAGGRRMQLAFQSATMVRSYRDKLLNENAGRPGTGTGVNENFRLETELTPILDKAELSALPDFVRGNLARGTSRLTDKSMHEFPVRFVLRDGRVLWE